MFLNLLKGYLLFLHLQMYFKTTNYQEMYKRQKFN